MSAGMAAGLGCGRRGLMAAGGAGKWRPERGGVRLWGGGPRETAWDVKRPGEEKRLLAGT